MKPRDVFASLITVLAALRFCMETYVDTEGNGAEVHEAIDHLQQAFESMGILKTSFSSLLPIASSRRGLELRVFVSALFVWDDLPPGLVWLACGI